MTTAQMAHAGEAPYYYVPPHSAHPIRASLSMLATLVGAALWVNSYAIGPWLVLAGILSLFIVLFGWFGQAPLKPGHSRVWESRVLSHGVETSRVYHSEPKKAEKNMTSEKMNQVMLQR